jgi:hypothetical protein
MDPPEPASRGAGGSPRALWASFEAVHAVNHFAPDGREHLAPTGVIPFPDPIGLPTRG